MREPWLVLVPTWARADGLCGTPDMSPALNYKALLYATPTHLPSICPFTRPHVIISALSMHLPPVLWAWIRAPATHFLGARILTTLPLSIPPAAFSALPQHLPSPFSVIILSSQYLFQRGPIWVSRFQWLHCLKGNVRIILDLNNWIWIYFGIFSHHRRPIVWYEHCQHLPLLGSAKRATDGRETPVTWSWRHYISFPPSWRAQLKINIANLATSCGYILLKCDT